MDEDMEGKLEDKREEAWMTGCLQLRDRGLLGAESKGARGQSAGRVGSERQTVLGRVADC